MNILSFLTFSIFAAESLISPLTSEYQTPIQEVTKPDISFSELAIPEVLGEETASEEPQSFVQKNKALSAIIALVILAIIYYAFIRKKKAGLPGPPKNPAGPTSPAA